MRGETILWHHSVPTGQTDSYNRPIFREEDTEVHEVLVAPEGISAPADGLSRRTNRGMALILTRNPGLKIGDEVTVRGEKYSIEDDGLGDWSTGLTGWNPGAEVLLKRARG